MKRTDWRMPAPPVEGLSPFALHIPGEGWGLLWARNEEQVQTGDGIEDDWHGIPWPFGEDGASADDLTRLGFTIVRG